MNSAAEITHSVLNQQLQKVLYYKRPYEKRDPINLSGLFSFSYCSFDQYTEPDINRCEFSESALLFFFLFGVLFLGFLFSEKSILIEIDGLFEVDLQIIHFILG